MGREGKTKSFYGLGSLGRDMGYCLMGNYLVVYMTEVLDLPDATLWWITAIMTVLRVFDALNDPIMGMIVDNTESRWGKFKPWILAGAILSAMLIISHVYRSYPAPNSLPDPVHAGVHRLGPIWRRQ